MEVAIYYSYVTSWLCMSFYADSLVEEANYTFRHKGLKNHIKLANNKLSNKVGYLYSKW